MTRYCRFSPYATLMQDKDTERPFASLSLFPATPAQTIESRRQTWQEWNWGRSLEQYLVMYSDTDKLEHSRDGKLVTWFAYFHQY